MIKSSLLWSEPPSPADSPEAVASVVTESSLPERMRTSPPAVTLAAPETVARASVRATVRAK